MIKIYKKLIFVLTMCLVFQQAKLPPVEATSTSSSSWMMTRIKMFNSKSGWSVGNFEGHNSVMVTNDNAKHWTDVSPKELQTSFDNDNPSQRNIGTFFLDDQVAWVAQSMLHNSVPVIVVYHTTNRGRSWTNTRFETFDQRLIDDIYIDFVNLKQGFLLSTLDANEVGIQYKAIYSTSDGGRTWHIVTGNQDPNKKGYPVPPLSGYATGFKFSDVITGWITTTHQGHSSTPLYKSDNCGESWVANPLKYSNPIHGRIFVDASAPIFFDEKRRLGVVGLSFNDAHQKVTIFYSTVDGGKNWIASTNLNLVGSEDDIVSDFYDPKHGWVWDSNGINLYSTSNAGQRWILLRSSAMSGVFYKPIQLNFVSPTIGWAIVRPGIALVKANNGLMVGQWTSLLFYTKDSGRTWIQHQYLASSKAKRTVNNYR